MFTKVVCLLALAVTMVVSIEHAHSSQHIHRHDTEVSGKGQRGHDHHEYYAYPKYEFQYKVDDHHTGDHKEQYEHRDGHDTKSKYSVHVDHIVPHHHHN